MCRAVQGKGRSSSEADRHQFVVNKNAIQLLKDFTRIIWGFWALS